MTRWCRPFDYVDGLDRENPNPSLEPGSAEAWAAMEKRLERERMDLAGDLARRVGRAKA